MDEDEFIDGQNHGYVAGFAMSRWVQPGRGDRVITLLIGPLALDGASASLRDFLSCLRQGFDDQQEGSASDSRNHSRSASSGARRWKWSP
jgi:hypothetical protein